MNRRGGAQNTRIIAVAAVTFVLGLVFGLILVPNLSPERPATATPTATPAATPTATPKLDATTTTFATETATRTTTRPPPAPPVEGDLYLLRVLDAAIDRLSDEDTDYYIFEVEVMYRGNKSWYFYQPWLQLLSDTGKKYFVNHNYILKNPLRVVRLNDGESVTGQVAFGVRKGEKPVKLLYVDWVYHSISIESPDIPAPSKEVSVVYMLSTDVVSEHKSVIAFSKLLTPGIKRFPLIASFYLSGEIIELEIRVRYNRVGLSPPFVVIRSISVEAFEVVRVEPALPVIVQDGGETVLKVALRTPEKGYAGKLKITIYA